MDWLFERGMGILNWIILGAGDALRLEDYYSSLVKWNEPLFVTENYYYCYY